MAKAGYVIIFFTLQFALIQNIKGQDFDGNKSNKIKQNKNDEYFPVSDGIIYSFPKSHRIAIDPQKLGHCMASIAKKFNTKLKFKSKRLKCEPFRPNGKGIVKPGFFIYLGAQERDCDYSTGNEEEIKRWVMSQPDNSIDILKIFQKSMSMNEGNITEALVTIHTLLRNLARYDDGTESRKGRYFYKSTPEEVGKFFNKFIDIRGDLTERGGDYFGDHKGSWYRIWGVFLGRLHMKDYTKIDAEYERCDSEKSIFRSDFVKFFNNFIAESGIRLVEFKVYREKDKYKTQLSLRASKTIEYFADEILDKKSSDKNDGNLCNETSYLISR